MISDGASDAVQLIVGLGNPGNEYEQTRHNVGFWFLDALVNRYSADRSGGARQPGGLFRAESKFFGEVVRLNIEGADVRLLKPMTFMNRSGQSIAALSRFFKIPVSAILVVHDELDLPVGRARLKRGGGHGGHNGLRDTIAQLGSKDFVRLRLGVDHPGDRNQVVDYVLNRPSGSDELTIRKAMDLAIDAVPALLKGDWNAATRELHAAC